MSQSTIGTITLKVKSLAKLVPFYRDNIGLQVHYQDATSAHLGVGDDDLLVLQEHPNSEYSRQSTGLYHFAILLPTRRDLARSLQHLMETNTQLQGASDHGVSEALYLADPEGNGIEIYTDRPRDAWYENGRFNLVTEALDFGSLMSELNGNTSFEGLPTDTIMGHIHLHVSDVAQSEAFYRDVLGLDVMMNLGYAGATFMSYEGYHHHIGANTWRGRIPAQPNHLGLEHFIIHLPESVDSDTILSRLEQANIPVTDHEHGILISDPSNNRIIVNNN